MNGSCSAKCHEGESPGIFTPFRNMYAGGSGHVLGHHLIDPHGSLFNSDTQRISDLFFHHFPGPGKIEFHFTAKEVICIQVAQDEGCIGYRCVISAQIVAGGTGRRPGTLRPHFQQSHGVYVSDTSASCPDFNHLDGWNLESKAAAFFEPTDPGSFKFS